MPKVHNEKQLKLVHWRMWRRLNVLVVYQVLQIYSNYTEHCSVGPTKLIETTIASTTTTARMKISDDEDFRF